MSRHGWNYRGERGWRTGVIYNTNLRTAYAAGRYKQMTDPDVVESRPYWRYVGGLSRDPRPEHLSWNGTVLRWDDPWWNDHFPPKGWGCKCKVVTHSEREVERLKQEGAVTRTTAPADQYYSWKNPRTGEITRIPRGVDPGWNYSIGVSAWGRTEALRLMEDQGPWVDLLPWGPEEYGRLGNIPIETANAEVGKPVKRGDVSALRQALRDAIGGDDVALTDPTGETTMITQAIVDHIIEKPQSRWDGREAYFSLIPELISDPYEIWISFARSEISGRTGIRKKYVKAIRIDKNRVIGLYAKTMNGQWVSGNFFRGGLTGAGNLRKGRLLYGK